MKSSRTRTEAAQQPSRPRTGWRPWAVVCVAATVVLGPAAVTASALEQADAAPLHHAVKADRTPACLPADSTRRRTAG
ncbi:MULTISPECIES: hypothetical protein [Streptomyces]|uniref:hypothetical protein n=1 Tax=Streptomyces TaxID=1883 RepID=UPI0004CD0D33|nr:hypothetical protein [Streptomyces durhamensis]